MDDALRVMVVDDNPEVVRRLTELLEDCGCDVAVARDGPSALKIAEVFRPQWAVLDLRAPKTSPVEAAHMLRGRYGGGMVLVAVAHWADVRRASRPELALVDHCLSGPLDAAPFRRILQRREPSR